MRRELFEGFVGAVLFAAQVVALCWAAAAFQGCAGAQLRAATPAVRGCAIVDRIEGAWVVVEGEDLITYDLPRALLPTVTEGQTLCADAALLAIARFSSQ